MAHKILLLASSTLMAAFTMMSFLPGTPTRAQNRREIEGATVEDNKITLKPGFEFVRNSNNGVSVRKKSAGKKDPPPPPGPSIVCACKASKDPDYAGSCSIRYSDTDAKCITEDDCTQCKFTPR